MGWLDDPLMAEPEVSTVVSRRRAVYTLAPLIECFGGTNDESHVGFLPFDLDPALTADITGQLSEAGVCLAN